MKNLSVLLLCILLLSTTLISQNKQGLSVGGSISYNSNTQTAGDEKMTMTSFTLAPKVGYFINNNIFVGAGIVLGHGNMEAGNNSSTNNSFTVEPFLRYYTPPYEGLRFFGNFSIPIGSVNTENKSVNNGQTISNEVKESFWGIRFVPGISYDITKIIAVEASVGAIEYVKTTDKNGNEVTYDHFSAGIDLDNVSIGFLIHL